MKMTMNYFKRKREEGFTIMETLVAIAILLLSITGPMVFSQNGLRAAFYARDQVTAFYLAQDAIEYVKNRRDHNVLSGNSKWLDGLLNPGDKKPCGINGTGKNQLGCAIDTSQAIGFKNPLACNPSKASELNCINLSESDGSSDGFLKIDSDEKFGFEGKESIFSRLVVIKETKTDVEAKVSVTVRWKSHEAIGVREITVVEYIYNIGDAWGLTQ